MVLELLTTLYSKCLGGNYNKNKSSISLLRLLVLTTNSLNYLIGNPYGVTNDYLIIYYKQVSPTGYRLEITKELHYEFPIYSI